MAPDLYETRANLPRGQGAHIEGSMAGGVDRLDGARLSRRREAPPATEAASKVLCRIRRRHHEQGVYTAESDKLGSKHPGRSAFMPRTEVLEENELQAMLAQCNTRTPSGARNRAILLLMARCGLRISEALAFSPKWVTHDPLANGQKCWMLRIPTQVRKRRQWIDPIPVAPDAKAALDAWASARESAGIRGGAWFCTISTGRRGGWDGEKDLEPGRPLNPRYVHDLVVRLAAKAGIERRIHPHVLRHTCGYLLYQDTGDIELVRRILGHASLSSTTRYMHVGDTALATAVGAIAKESDEGTVEVPAAMLRDLLTRVTELEAKARR